MTQLLPPNATNMSNDDILQWKYMNVLAMKVMGFKYSVIAEKTGYSENHIKRLFHKNGKLYHLANQFREVAQKESVQETMDVILGELPEVVRTMAQTAKMPFDMSGVAAGKTLLEYGIGKAIDREKAGTGLGVGTTADLVERVALRRKQNESGSRGQISSGVAG